MSYSINRLNFHMLFASNHADVTYKKFFAPENGSETVATHLPPSVYGPALKWFIDTKVAG